MTGKVYTIVSGLPGTLSIAERPGAGSVLPDLMALRDAGVDTVLSMLEPNEASQLGLSSEADLCMAVGMRFMSCPVADLQLPEPEKFLRSLEGASQIIGHGAHLAVHCRASIGRSGMATSVILGMFGYDAAEAIQATSKARGLPIPDTPEQSGFIHKMIGEL